MKRAKAPAAYSKYVPVENPDYNKIDARAACYHYWKLDCLTSGRGWGFEYYHQNIEWNVYLELFAADLKRHADGLQKALNMDVPFIGSPHDGWDYCKWFGHVRRSMVRQYPDRKKIRQVFKNYHALLQDYGMIDLYKTSTQPAPTIESTGQIKLF